MIFGNKCCCLFAALVAFCTILVITYISGYTMGNWNMATWLAVAVITTTAVFCLRCRQKEDDDLQ